MKQNVRLYVTAIVALNLVAAVAVAFLTERSTLDDWRSAAFFSILGFFGMLLSYQRRGSAVSGSVSIFLFLSAVLVTPTLAASTTVFVAALIANGLQKKPLSRTLFNASQCGIAAAAAVLVLSSRGPLCAGIELPCPTHIGFDMMHAVLFCVAALVFIAANHLLVVGAISLAEDRPYWLTWRKLMTSTFVYDALALPIIALLAWSYVSLGMWWLLAIVLPLFGLRQLYKQNAQLERVTEELLQLMVAAMEARDPYTSGHSRRVSAYSRIIARSARLSLKAVERIGVAALLHDVGKIHEIYAPILRKPGRLSPEEFVVIQTHSIKSAELVNKVTQLRDLVPAVRAHHERWDGRGYPDGLAAEQVPLGARVIALADTIDAMRTTRPYRGPLDPETVRAEVAAGRGSQFDPALVDALLHDAVWDRLLQAMRRFEGLRSEETLTDAELENLEFARPSGSYSAA